jgi:hypothetical protein
MNERTHKRKNARMHKRTNGRQNERTDERIHGRHINSTSPTACQEHDVKVLRKELAHVLRKKETAEEQLASHKRDQRRGLEKMSSVLVRKCRVCW